MCEEQIYKWKWKTNIDVLETASILNKKGFIVTVDIEKAFDSVDHSFLLAVLQKYGFGERFLKWIQILIKNQESCKTEAL